MRGHYALQVSPIPVQFQYISKFSKLCRDVDLVALCEGPQKHAERVAVLRTVCQTAAKPARKAVLASGVQAQCVETSSKSGSAGFEPLSCLAGPTLQEGAAAKKGTCSFLFLSVPGCSSDGEVCLHGLAARRGSRTLNSHGPPPALNPKP